MESLSAHTRASLSDRPLERQTMPFTTRQRSEHLTPSFRSCGRGLSRYEKQLATSYASQEVVNVAPVFQIERRFEAATHKHPSQNLLPRLPLHCIRQHNPISAETPRYHSVFKIMTHRISLRYCGQQSRTEERPRPPLCWIEEQDGL